jgi:hypothetical protein
VKIYFPQFLFYKPPPPHIYLNDILCTCQTILGCSSFSSSLFYESSDEEQQKATRDTSFSEYFKNSEARDGLIIIRKSLK